MAVDQIKPPDTFAHTNVNVTLTDSDTVYERQTWVDSPPGANISIRRFVTVAKLTTHGDIYQEFDIEFSPDADPEWNNNFTLFENSTVVEDYRDTYIALQEFIPTNISILEIATSSFETFWDNITESLSVFSIHQTIVFQQATAFILSLREPFLFDLNGLELSRIYDFHFRYEWHSGSGFEGDGGAFLMEQTRIKAPGSPLEYVSSTKGYEGNLYLAPDPWGANPVPIYFGHVMSVPQDIIVTIELPDSQTLSYDFDSEYKNKVDTEDMTVMKTEDNVVTFEFDKDSYFPYYVQLTSFTPFLEQFTFSDYASWAIGGLAGLFTVVKGIPFFFSRRSFGKFRQQLHVAVETNDTRQFERLQEQAIEEFVAGKITAKELENIRSEVSLLKKFQDRIIQDGKSGKQRLDEVLDS